MNKKLILINNIIMILPPEQPYGNIEYKWKLINLNELHFQKRITQLKFRLDEGLGEALYYLGIMDDGTLSGLNENELNESKQTLEKMCNFLDSSLQLLQYIQIDDNKKCGEYLIRYNNHKYIDLKIGVIGNVDSGKSTLVGVLSKGNLDDGRGLARSSVFNFKHEINTGRTSSVGHQIMGFDKDGKVITSKKNWDEIINHSLKIITFYDLAGHERYLRTTIYGLTSNHPDYCILVVGGNQGMNIMTREHISLCISLQIPFIIVVTKIDIAPEDVLKENMRKINKMIKNKVQKIPFRIKSHNDVLTVIKNIKSNSIVPIFQISNVTNDYLDLLKLFLNLVPIRNNYSQFVNKPIEMLIDSHFQITGFGTVVSGLIKSGTININDNVYLGPLMNGEFIKTKVKSIHVKHKDVKEASAGLYSCVCLKNINRKIIKKGMVLLGENAPQKIYKTFWAKITIIQSQHTTIRVGYQPYLHIGQVRQCASIVEIKKINPLDENDTVLRTGDKAYVKLQFLNKAEYIKKDMNLVFRDGLVKAFGIIIDDPNVI